MKILVIGGSGHVGSFLVPQLTAADHSVFIATRGTTAVRGYSDVSGAQFISCDASRPATLEPLAHMGFDTVIDFPGTAYNVWQVLRKHTKHIIACGSLWMYGKPHTLPTPEALQSPCPFEGYARRFAEINEMIVQSGQDGNAVFTAIMPPNICGPGKIPLEPMGGRSAAVHADMAAGKPITLPEGADCTISPCHAADIAALFALAAQNPDAAAGQIFNVGPAYGLTAEQFVQAYADIYGVDIPIVRVPWQTYITQVNPDMGSWWHFYAHMLPDISKARTLLGYQPRYTPQQAMREAVEWMRAR